MSVQVPGAVRPLIAFPALLRAYGFMIAPEQTVSFLQAVELLGPAPVLLDARPNISCLADVGLLIAVEHHGVDPFHAVPRGQVADGLQVLVLVVQSVWGSASRGDFA